MDSPEIRNNQMKYFKIAIIAITWAFISISCRSQNPPNILVILSDDMNWHHPGFNGGPVLTPNLDRLAEQGTMLSQFYVHSVCSPTRAAFLTGRYPFRNGMEERSHGDDVAGMLTDERTMADALKEAGYYTGIIGKWHLGNWYKQHLPMQRGFEYQYGLYGALISYYNKTRARFYDWHRNELTLRQEDIQQT
jgi:arylsulfatase A-like enzyme